MRRAACALAAEQTDSGPIPEPDGRGTLAPDATPLRILVDGLAVPTLPFPSQNLVKGDAKSLFIAAASILAKTARDAYCETMERNHPGYGFAVHKGYPTPAHLAALNQLGPCPEHRRSFGPVADACFFHGFPV
jgi:ribonuclease HII